MKFHFLFKEKEKRSTQKSCQQSPCSRGPGLARLPCGSDLFQSSGDRNADQHSSSAYLMLPPTFSVTVTNHPMPAFKTAL